MTIPSRPAPRPELTAASTGIALLLLDAGVGLYELTPTFRMEEQELYEVLAAPASMRAVHRIMLAGALELHADRTPQPKWARAIAAFLRSDAIEDFQARAMDRFRAAIARDPESVQSEVAAFLLEECGPELFEHMPIAPGTPNN